jgi:hypothetical protein
MEDHVRKIEEGCRGLKPGWTRVGFNYFISDAEADFILRAVDWVATHGWKLLPYYEFDAVTGDWRHQDWRAHAPMSLHDIRYEDGELRFSSRHTEAGEDAFDAYFRGGGPDPGAGRGGGPGPGPGADPPRARLRAHALVPPGPRGGGPAARRARRGRLVLAPRLAGLCAAVGSAGRQRVVRPVVLGVATRAGPCAPRSTRSRQKLARSRVTWTGRCAGERSCMVRGTRPPPTRGVSRRPKTSWSRTASAGAVGVRVVDPDPGPAGHLEVGGRQLVEATRVLPRHPGQERLAARSTRRSSASRRTPATKGRSHASRDASSAGSDASGHRPGPGRGGRPGGHAAGASRRSRAARRARPPGPRRGGPRPRRRVRRTRQRRLREGEGAQHPASPGHDPPRRRPRRPPPLPAPGSPKWCSISARVSGAARKILASAPRPSSSTATIQSSPSSAWGSANRAPRPLRRRNRPRSPSRRWPMRSGYASAASTPTSSSACQGEPRPERAWPPAPVAPGRLPLHGPEGTPVDGVSRARPCPGRPRTAPGGALRRGGGDRRRGADPGRGGCHARRGSPPGRTPGRRPPAPGPGGACDPRRG